MFKSIIVILAFWVLGLVASVFIEYALYELIISFYELPPVGFYTIGFSFGLILITFIKVKGDK